MNWSCASENSPVPTRPQHHQHCEAEQHEAADRDPRRSADVVLHERLAAKERRRDRRSSNQRASAGTAVRPSTEPVPKAPSNRPLVRGCENRPNRTVLNHEAVTAIERL